MWTGSVHLMKKNVVIILLVVVLSQSQLDQRVKSRCSAALRHGGRCFCFLGKISCKLMRKCVFLWVKVLLALYVWKWQSVRNRNVSFFSFFFFQQNFKWEEQNFVVQNEINNLIFLVKRAKDSKVSSIYQSTGTLFFSVLHFFFHSWDYGALKHS